MKNKVLIGLRDTKSLESTENIKAPNEAIFFDLIKYVNFVMILVLDLNYREYASLTGSKDFLKANFGCIGAIKSQLEKVLYFSNRIDERGGKKSAK